MLKDIESKLKNPQPEIFLAAQKSIFLLMVEGTFDYFVKSERYRAFQSTYFSPPASEFKFVGLHRIESIDTLGNSKRNIKGQDNTTHTTTCSGRVTQTQEAILDHASYISHRKREGEGKGKGKRKRKRKGKGKRKGQREREGEREGEGER